ncbi:hypothetical protein HYV83_05575 [Candidatus Woesearchaeota archaeon]|nr:hypothetical protein [Candidatus Woesearchaeota archaeon]
MYGAYQTQSGRGYSGHNSYSASGASGLENAVQKAYNGSHSNKGTAAPLSTLSHGNSVHTREYSMSYVAMAARLNPYSSTYFRNTSSSSSCLSVSGKDSATAVSNGTIYHLQPVLFLNPSRPKTRFIAAAVELSEFIKEAFAKMMQKELPEDIAITVAARGILQQLHKQFFNEGVVGLSLNNDSGREIFAVAGNMDEVMLVIGHELGHVLTPTLSNGQAEEAKAFAFEMAWAQTIFANDIAGLRNSINSASLNIKPAANGVHDLAFAFVKAATLAGKEPLSLHSELSLQQQDFSSEFEDLQQPSLQPIAYVSLTNSSTPSYHSGGYLNRSSVQNVPWLQNFTWADLGTGVYGMYIPLTASIFMNDRLLRTNLEQFHKTLGHEYILHHVMQLPDNYVTKVLEETIFWVKEEEDKYKP